MKKPLLLLFALFPACPFVEGAVLSPQEALQRMTRMSASLTRSQQNDLQLAFTQDSEKGEPALYVFNNGISQGYILLSADDVAAPVLGYAESGVFDLGNIPRQMKWWMEEYGRQIQYARENGCVQYTVPTRASKSAVAPLVKTRWDQTKPYNNNCPLINGKATLTGCVATAMAQVMKYWNYPDKGSGTVSVTYGDSQRSSLNLSLKSFAWDDMLDSYSGDYTATQAAAVAYLMQACGYASEMIYSTEESGALSAKAARALVNSFGYNPNLQFMERNYYTAEEWENTIYDEISAGRPVLYSGVSPSGGHEFVCDGYSSDGYFHFNWGWSGMSDGYFILNALNPQNLGSGGGTGGGFNYAQDIIIGIQPTALETPTARMTQLGNLSVFIKSGKINLALSDDGDTGFWCNTGVSAINVDLGIRIEPVEGTSGSTRYVVIKSGEIKAPVYVSNEDGSYNVNYGGVSGNVSVTLPSDLADGKYKLTVVSKSVGQPDSAYLPVLTSYSDYNHVSFTKNGNTYSVESMKAASVTIVDGGAVTETYYGYASKLKIELKNDSRKEITGTYCPALMLNGVMIMKGDGITETVAPGESVIREFITQFELEEKQTAPSTATTYTLMFYDPSTGVTYDWNSSLTMNFTKPSVDFSITDFKVVNAEYKDVTLSGPSTINTWLYAVEDASAIPFSCRINVTDGFWGSPVCFAIFKGSGGESLAFTYFSETPVLTAGESMDLSATLDFSAGNEGENYICSLYYYDGRFLEIKNAVPIAFTITKSGIEMIEIAGELEMAYERATGTLNISSTEDIILTVCSLDGKSFTVPVGVQGDHTAADLTQLPSGVYIVRAISKSGATKVLKITR